MTKNAEMPSVRFFGSGDPIHVSAQQLWLILVTKVESAKRNESADPTLNYGGEGSATHLMGRSLRAGRTIDRQLGMIAKYCISNGIPALNVIVVNKEKGRPGRQVLHTPGKTFQQEIKDIYAFDWFGVRVPTTGSFRKIREADD